MFGLFFQKKRQAHQRKKTIKPIKNGSTTKTRPGKTNQTKVDPPHPGWGVPNRKTALVSGRKPLFFGSRKAALFCPAEGGFGPVPTRVCRFRPLRRKRQTALVSDRKPFFWLAEGGFGPDPSRVRPLRPKRQTALVSGRKPFFLARRRRLWPRS